MPIKRLLKQNITLSVGIALPLLLVMIFALGAVLPKTLVSRPKYDLLYMTLPYPHDGVSTEVREGKLFISISPEVRKRMLPMPRLFHFDTKTYTSTEIPIILPLISPTPLSLQNEIVEIAEIKNLNLDPKNRAPDGYKAEFSAPNYSTPINFLISNSHKRSLVITKNGNSIMVAEETNNMYGDKSIKFLGWIIPE